VGLSGEVASLLSKSPLVGTPVDRPVLALAKVYGVSKAFLQVAGRGERTSILDHDACW
jgi:hypothetical protein